MPLTLMGRINLFKMIFLPKLLHILSNSPLYVSVKVFRHINSIVVEVLWRSRGPRISLPVLKLPVTMGFSYAGYMILFFCNSIDIPTLAMLHPGS